MFTILQPSLVNVAHKDKDNSFNIVKDYRKTDVSEIPNTCQTKQCPFVGYRFLFADKSATDTVFSHFQYKSYRLPALLRHRLLYFLLLFSICLKLCLFVCLPVCQSVCFDQLIFYLFISLSFSSVCLPACLTFCLFVSRSFCQSVCLLV